MSCNDSPPGGLNILADTVPFIRLSYEDTQPSSMTPTNSSVPSAVPPVSPEHLTLVPTDEHPGNQANDNVDHNCAAVPSAIVEAQDVDPAHHNDPGTESQSAVVSTTRDTPSPTINMHSHIDPVSMTDENAIKTSLPDVLSGVHSLGYEPQRSDFGVQTVPIIRKRGA